MLRARARHEALNAKLKKEQIYALSFEKIRAEEKKITVKDAEVKATKLIEEAVKQEIDIAPRVRDILKHISIGGI